MTQRMHPRQALFEGERPFPVVPSCEHFAGSEKLIGKAFELQAKLGPVFDITMDCEDGAPTGREKQHAEMVVAMQTSAANKFKQAGVRVHDPAHDLWRQDVDVVVRGAGEHLAYITIPKPTAASQVAEMIRYIQETAQAAGVKREIPIHVLIETHGALREVWDIARLPWVQVLDFGLMDFVSGHHGAIPSSAMKSPGQFEHALVARAKAEVVAAALAAGVVPAHNVTLDLKNVYQTHADARRARDEFGFLRMWSIYPAQIQPIVAAMAPDFSEVARASEILLAAQAAAWGPIQHAGDLHDRATYRYFWELVQRAHVSGQQLPEEVAAWFA
ncbi:MAG: CoA ester lyase [Kofleriaceae bacterium]|nr:CoA ester lyase [Myxococcales bacterium]MCB9563210.1 CoA ester lyase [Kofleriaceae bacterium]MCB9573607.1 CoA ester lyase [Kofleriaceae bacterium]